MRCCRKHAGRARFDAIDRVQRFLRNPIRRTGTGQSRDLACRPRCKRTPYAIPVAIHCAAPRRSGRVLLTGSVLCQLCHQFLAKLPRTCVNSDSITLDATRHLGGAFQPNVTCHRGKAYLQRLYGKQKLSDQRAFVWCCDAVADQRHSKAHSPVHAEAYQDERSRAGDARQGGCSAGRDRLTRL